MADHQMLHSSRDTYDEFCWLCTRSINIDLDYRCSICGRAFHYGCKKVERNRAWPKLMDDFMFTPGDSCLVCSHTFFVETFYSSDEVPALNRAIAIAIDKLIQQPVSAIFREPVNKMELPTYSKYIINPMDLSTMLKHAENGIYKSAEEFYYDLRLILHNCIIFNSNHGQYTKMAKDLFTEGCEEYCRLTYCYECYLRAEENPHFYKSAQFLLPCRRPHSLVWALGEQQTCKQYFPAKVVNFRDKGKESDMDLVFFGSRQLVSHVPLSQCFAFSLERPKIDPVSKIGPRRKAVIDAEIAQYLQAIRNANPSVQDQENADQNLANNPYMDADELLRSCVTNLEGKGFAVYHEANTLFRDTQLFMLETKHKFCPIVVPK